MKNVLKEGSAMIVLVLAIMLILVIVFFDYIKDSSNKPVSKVYSQSEEVKNILEEKKKYDTETNSVTLSSAYSIDMAALSQYRESQDLRQGQTSPFDELPITEIQYDREGNAYYKVSSDTQVKGYDTVPTNTVAGTTSTQNYIGSTSNETNYSFNNDINSPSENKSLVTTQSSGK